MKRTEVDRLRAQVKRLNEQLERCRQRAYAHEINALLNFQLQLARETIEEISEERDRLQHEVWSYAGNVAPIERGMPEPVRYRVAVRARKQTG